jgi:hypothetical protein
MIISAPLAIKARKASGNAMSQQMSRPTFPSGVGKALCGSCEEEVRCGRSGCQRFFFVYWPAMVPSLVMNVATFVRASPCFSTMVPGTMQMLSSAARAR